MAAYPAARITSGRRNRSSIGTAGGCRTTRPSAALMLPSPEFKSVGLFDFARVAVAPLQALEPPLADDAGAVQQVPRQQPQYRDAVDGALEERCRRCLFEVPGWHRHFGDPHLDVDQLRHDFLVEDELVGVHRQVDRKSTRLNSSHLGISYAVFCLKKTIA